MERKNAWKTYTAEQLDELHYLCEGYKAYISDNKTERECCDAAVEMAREGGYVELGEAVAAGKQLKAGDKVYVVNRGKSLMLVNLGTDDLEAGVNILGAHIDSPRMDLKQNPLEEKNDLLTLDTHYYGGIKKYQWVTIPLAIHGVVAKKDGSIVNVCVGEDEGDPVFCVTDLLIHLSQEQLTKEASKVIDGEMLDVLCGGRPVVIEGDDAKKADDKDLVKKGVLAILKETLDIEEEDLLSAELEVVPAGPARDLGFDRSMILGYGQDDRSCAYTSLVAQLDEKDVRRTSVCLLVDKEEVGSVGATGMTSRFFENSMAEVLALAGKQGDLALRRCLTNSQMLSSDVSAGFDPTFASAFEAKNSSYLGRGLTFNKFTGARGKHGSNDADAEYVAKIRRVMDEGGVNWQTAELGRVDLGGGGTIAYILAEYGMSVIDCGVPVLSMHSPWETTSKADIYEAYRGYRSFLERA
ncbi:aminopeptidase [Paratractidigestivibacter sp.]|uniref:aminopeptidase n=1 Tax=Paratractidigestivibacter sp. TaxID=2847316 RepID=UPI003AB8BC49